MPPAMHKLIVTSSDVSFPPIPQSFPADPSLPFPSSSSSEGALAARLPGERRKEKEKRRRRRRRRRSGISMHTHESTAFLFLYSLLPLSEIADLDS